MPAEPRIVVVGSSCSGKSTLAQKLAAAHGCACIELDELFWAEHWTPKPQQAFLHLVAQAAAGEHWVAAGNYGGARHLLWPRATAIIWLNYSLPCVLWRGVRRTILRATTRQPLFHGNRESWRRSFLSRESILWWIVSTHQRRKREFETLRASCEYPHLRWLEAPDPKAAEAILQSLVQAVPKGGGRPPEGSSVDVDQLRR